GWALDGGFGCDFSSGAGPTGCVCIAQILQKREASHEAGVRKPGARAPGRITLGKDGPGPGPARECQAPQGSDPCLVVPHDVRLEGHDFYIGVLLPKATHAKKGESFPTACRGFTKFLRPNS